MYRLLMEQDVPKRSRIEAVANKERNLAQRHADAARPGPGLPIRPVRNGGVDVCAIFRALRLNEYFWGFVIPKSLTRVERWRRAVLSHDAVRATSLPPDHYVKLYADYALGFTNGAIPPGHERSALAPEIPLDARPMPPRRV